MIHSSPKLPSVDSLAAIAAIIANGGSHDKEPARTALNLWKECHRLIQLEEMVERNNSEPDPERDEFLAACGLTQSDIELGGVVPGRPVPLEEFLKAIAPNSKPETMLEKWEAFWYQEKENPARRGRETASFFETMKLPEGPDQAIDRDSMVDLRMLFLIFLGKQNQAFGIKRGTAGPRARKVYGAVRAVKVGRTLTPKIKDVLKSITAEERLRSIDFVGLKPEDIPKLDAAIESSKTPVSGRPRVKRK